MDFPRVSSELGILFVAGRTASTSVEGRLST